MKKIISLILVGLVCMLGLAALAEGAATAAEKVSEDVIDRFTDTWVAVGYTAEISYDEAEGGFHCDMVIEDSFCDFADCRYDAEADMLMCEGGVRYYATLNEETLDYEREIISEGLIARFTLEGDHLVCEDSEELLKDVSFLRLNDAEAIDGDALTDKTM